MEGSTTTGSAAAAEAGVPKDDDEDDEAIEDAAVPAAALLEAPPVAAAAAAPPPTALLTGDSYSVKVGFLGDGCDMTSGRNADKDSAAAAEPRDPVDAGGDDGVAADDVASAPGATTPGTSGCCFGFVACGCCLVVEGGGGGAAAVVSSSAMQNWFISFTASVVWLNISKYFVASVPVRRESLGIGQKGIDRRFEPQDIMKRGLNQHDLYPSWSRAFRSRQGARLRNS
jgi:hypothetical protein